LLGRLEGQSGQPLDSGDMYVIRQMREGTIGVPREMVSRFAVLGVGTPRNTARYRDINADAGPSGHGHATPPIGGAPALPDTADTTPIGDVFGDRLGDRFGDGRHDLRDT